MNDIRNCNSILVNNYADYIRYTTRFRNYPDIVDGCKPSHRRCIHQIYKDCPKHFVKAATAIGSVVKAHPHPSSIFGTLIPLTQKDGPFPIFDGQGNWGSKIPQSEASAERYVEIKISDLSSIIFESFSDFVDMVEGDLNNIEPERLATFLPLSLINGTYSIPTGMSTVDSPPLWAPDLCDYAIEVLRGKDLSKISDVFIRPNLGDVQIKSSRADWKNLIETGQGKISILPKIKITGDKRLEIVALPDTKTIEHVNKILQTELDRDQIDVRDETTKNLSIVVEILPYKKVNIETLAKRLTSKLTTTRGYRMIYSNDGAATFCGVYTNMRYCLEYLVKCAQRWSNKSVEDLSKKLKIFEAIESLKIDGNLTKLPKMGKNESIQFITKTYGITEPEAKEVLSKPISYITKEHDAEIKSLRKDLSNMKKIDSDIYSYLIERYEDIKKKIQEKFSDRNPTTFYTAKSRMKNLVS